MQTSSKDKIKALILYICDKIPPELSGTIKLNKIIWFCETETMYETGAPLTGHLYIRQRHGPVALNAPIMRDELVSEGALRDLPAEPMPGGGVRHPYVTINSIDLKKIFSEKQIQIINNQIERFRNSGARDISELSHDSVWASLEDADEMPLDLYVFKPHYSEAQKESVAKFSHDCEKEYGD